MAGALRKSSMDSNNGTGIRPGSASAALDAHAAQASQPDHIEHILGARSAANHVVTYGFRRGGRLQLGNGAEGIDHVGGRLQ